jgi:hypothetical protein
MYLDELYGVHHYSQPLVTNKLNSKGCVQGHNLLAPSLIHDRVLAPDYNPPHVTSLLGFVNFHTIIQ